MGKIACNLGNVYKTMDFELANGSPLFWILQEPLQIFQKYPQISSTGLRKALQAIEQAIAPLDQVEMNREDAILITREFTLTARMMRHACQLGLLLLDPNQAQNEALRRLLALDMEDLSREYQEIWLLRNRPGGLADSLARFPTIKPLEGTPAE